jgi:hypothetical protein
MQPVSQKDRANLKIEKVRAAPVSTGKETERSPSLLEEPAVVKTEDKSRLSV